MQQASEQARDAAQAASAAASASALVAQDAEDGALSAETAAQASAAAAQASEEAAATSQASAASSATTATGAASTATTAAAAAQAARDAAQSSASTATTQATAASQSAQAADASADAAAASEAAAAASASTAQDQATAAAGSANTAQAQAADAQQAKTEAQAAASTAQAAAGQADDSAGIATGQASLAAQHATTAGTHATTATSAAQTATQAADEAEAARDAAQAAATAAFEICQASDASPIMDSVAAAGSSKKFARADHVHPTDTSRAPLASPALTGTPTAPTPANGTNTQQIATTAFVLATRLDQLAAPTADVSMNSRKITGLAEPVGAQDAATKNYVDMAVQGLTPKQSVKAATTANITSLSGAMTIDGIALVAGDRILVKDQTTASQNGIYVVQSGAWTRADDASTWAELVSAYVFVEQGTTNADNGFLCTSDAGGVLGSTAVTFVQFSGAGQITAGAGLTKTGNQLDVAAGTGITVAADNVALTGQALALHNLATNGLVTRTAAGTVAARSVAASGTGIAVSNGDGVSGNPTVSLSAALSTVGGLTPAADRMAYYTSASTAALATLTSFGRSLMDDADAAAGRATLGLGTMATQNADAVAITGGTIDGITIDGGTF